ncbi:hypothetical protein F2Q69_00005886 [Brassica cretica]|uniref:Uncharacterized protein n=2 Tax=Brassica cretica TaxID=69181 RepID=A0A8S9P8M3_BRACR|nr:hypothetical protein F2Q69_00005886 [Brassica cretica]
MKSSEYTEEFPRKFRVRRNIPRKFRGTMCSSEKTDEFRGNIIAVGEPLGDFTKFRGNSDELAFSVGIPSEFPRDMFLRIYRGTVPSEYSEERVPRNIPRKMSLGIIRGNSSVGIFLSIDVYMSKTHRSMNVRGNIPTKFSLGIFRGHFRQNNGPRNFLGNLFPRNSVGKFRGISDERRNSEELFPTTCFVGMSSE